MVCDYRVVTEDATMGLNEVALGITVPLMWYRCMAALIGQGKAEKLTIFAKIVGAKEALSLGLVDEIASGVSELLPRAEKVATELSRLPAGSRAITKDHSRGPLSREWGNAERLEDEVKGAFASLESPEVTAMLKGVLARLSKGSAKAKL
jgi:3,2-trans-enoyl-CoA isomerase